MKIILKEIREKRGMSVKELSEKSGVSRQLIYRIEGGAETTLSTLEKLAKPLNVSIRNIFLP